MAITLAISVFKAQCIRILKEARRTGKAVVVTLRGEPIARLEPIQKGTRGRKLGQLRHLVTS